MGKKYIYIKYNNYINNININIYIYIYIYANFFLNLIPIIRYSLTDTWGGEAIPRDGDSIYVPSDEVLIVD